MRLPTGANSRNITIPVLRPFLLYCPGGQVPCVKICVTYMHLVIVETNVENAIE